MAMYPCTKCLENNWTFRKEDDGTHTAICLNCEHEVNFTYKEKKKKTILEEGRPCRKCGQAIRLRDCPYKEGKLKKEYFYTAYYWCDHCRAIYYSDKFKVTNRFFKIDNVI